MNRPRDGKLEILEERVLVGIPRGDEELRVTWTRARTAAGREVTWHSIRVFWRDDSGAWRAGKSGVTVRTAELKSVAETLIKAAAGAIRHEQPRDPDDNSDLDCIFGRPPR